MRPRIPAVLVSSEASEFADDLRRIFGDLDRMTGGGLTGECSPPVDVYETDASVEIAVDLPGIDPALVRVIAKGSTIIIAGEKAPRRARMDSTFHLVERGYGRFARAIRLTTACDFCHVAVYSRSCTAPISPGVRGAFEGDVHRCWPIRPDGSARRS